MERFLSRHATILERWCKVVYPYILAAGQGFVSSNHVYVVGGGGDSLHDDVLSAAINPDGSLGGWATVSHLPQTLIWHTLAQNGSTVYILGGVKVTGSLNSVNTVYSANVNPDGSLSSWETLTPLPQKLDLGGAGTWNNKLYYFGGENYRYSSGISV